MTCPCKMKKKPLDRPRAPLTKPLESCLYCAEKHLGTASALARELGYEAPNLGFIVGELVAAAWHLAAGGPERQALAEKIRDFRHAIQQRTIRPLQADFAPFLREIDRLISAEKDASVSAAAPAAAEPINPVRDDTAIVLSGRPDLLSAWLCAWKNSPNAGRWPVCIFDTGQLTEAFRENAVKIPGVTVSDLSADVAAAAKRIGTTKPYGAHACKTAALLRCPKRYAVWFDHDVEILGDITPIVEQAIASGKWFAAPMYGSFGVNLYVGKRVAQNALMVVDTQSQQLRKWHEEASKIREWSDELVFARVFGVMDATRLGICNLYRPEWYASPDTMPEMRTSIPAATDALMHLDPLPIVRHWCGLWGPRAFLARYPEGETISGEKPPAPSTPAIEVLDDRVPLVVPLAYRPDAPDHELKILLRSVAENARNLGEIIIGLDGPGPQWPPHGFDPARRTGKQGLQHRQEGRGAFRGGRPCKPGGAVFGRQRVSAPG